MKVHQIMLRWNISCTYHRHPVLEKHPLTSTHADTANNSLPLWFLHTNDRTDEPYYMRLWRVAAKHLKALVNEKTKDEELRKVRLQDWRFLQQLRLVIRILKWTWFEKRNCFKMYGGNRRIIKFLIYLLNLLWWFQFSLKLVKNFLLFKEKHWNMKIYGSDHNLGRLRLQDSQTRVNDVIQPWSNSLGLMS